MSKIKFIYFDVGGVLIKDFSKTNKFELLLKDLGLDDKEGEDFINKFSEKEDEICCGHLSCEEFFINYQKQRPIRTSGEYSLYQDFVNRFELNLSIHNLVKEVSKKHKIGLLTNMYPGMLDKIKERKLLPDVKWDVEVDSSLVHFAKPDLKIFELSQKLSGVDPAEILYIDNTQRHLDAAKAAGWKTFLYDPADAEKSTQELREFIKSFDN